MNRQLTALFAALEALLVVGVGIGIPLVPLTLLWAFQYGLQFDWIVFWRASVDVWLLGHGVNVRFVLDPAIAAASGLPGAEQGFAVTIAPLAFALVTVLLGARAGRRIGETPHRRLGPAVAVGAFAALSLGATASAFDPAASPSLWQGILLPTVVFALGVAIGSLVSFRRLAVGRGADDPLHRLLARADDRLPTARPAATIALTGGVGAVAIVLACSAVTVAVLVAVSYGRIIGLYQAVQSEVLGGVALTIGQLGFIPNLVIWASAWFVGPGFAVGTGSAVGPLGTAVGPLPAVPLLGALPEGELPWGFVGILVPVLAGFLAGSMLRPRIERAGLDSWQGIVGVGLASGVVGGALLGGLSWIASGAAGPGRLVDVGAQWLPVAAWSTLEIGVAVALALWVAGLSRRDSSVASEADPVEPERVEATR